MSDSNLAVESACRDIAAIRDTLDLDSEGDSNTTQLAGPYNEIKKAQPDGYEAHHIPSRATVESFGASGEDWPAISLTKDDHKQTDSFAGKQGSKHTPVFGHDGDVKSYKDETIDLMGQEGGFIQLVRDEIYNIKDRCGGRYDGAIAQYLDELEEYIKRKGIPFKRV